MSEIVLPEGFGFKNFECGDEKSWAELEYEVGDFDSVQEAEKYFIDAYCKNEEETKNRCIFVVNEQGKIIGSCIAWRDRKGSATVASLHWLIVSPDYRDKKIGKALAQKVMQIFRDLNEIPIYIHTQPWSYKAVLLYIWLGFQLQSKDTFSNYENQYVQAMDTLKNVLTEQQYEELVANSV